MEQLKVISTMKMMPAVMGNRINDIRESRSETLIANAGGRRQGMIGLVNGTKILALS
jgi:hypothetical protein